MTLRPAVNLPYLVTQTICQTLSMNPQLALNVPKSQHGIDLEAAVLKHYNGANQATSGAANSNTGNQQQQATATTAHSTQSTSSTTKIGNVYYSFVVIPVKGSNTNMRNQTMCISKIPLFDAVLQVPQIIQILRQQLMFNELLTSCFTKPKAADTAALEAMGASCYTIEVQSLAMNKLVLHTHVQLQLISIEISMNELTSTAEVSVQMSANLLQRIATQMSGGSSIAQSSQEQVIGQINMASTKVLNQYKSVPVLVHFVCNELFPSQQQAK